MTGEACGVAGRWVPHRVCACTRAVMGALSGLDTRLGAGAVVMCCPGDRDRCGGAAWRAGTAWDVGGVTAGAWARLGRVCLLRRHSTAGEAPRDRVHSGDERGDVGPGVHGDRGQRRLGWAATPHMRRGARSRRHCAELRV